MIFNEVEWNEWPEESKRELTIKVRLIDTPDQSNVLVGVLRDGVPVKGNEEVPCVRLPEDSEFEVFSDPSNSFSLLLKQLHY